MIECSCCGKITDGSCCESHRYQGPCMFFNHGWDGDNRPPWERQKCDDPECFCQFTKEEWETIWSIRDVWESSTIYRGAGPRQLRKLIKWWRHRGFASAQIRCEVDAKRDMRYYYELPLEGKDLEAIFSHKDYWSMETSNFSQETIEANQEAYRDLAKRVLDLKPASVLEVGCGLGYVVKFLREAGIEAWGVDISSWAVEHAVTPICQGNVLSLTTEKLKLPVDLVFSVDLMEHIPVSLLDIAKRELTHAGKRNFHLISCGSLEGDWDVTHVTMHKIDWWRQQFPDFMMENKG